MKLIVVIIGLCLLPWVLGALAGICMSAVVAVGIFVEAVWKAVKP